MTLPVTDYRGSLAAAMTTAQQAKAAATSADTTASGASSSASSAMGAASQASTEAAAAVTTAAAAKTAALQGAVAWIVDVAITYNSPLSLSLVPKAAPFSIAAAKVDDRLYVHRHGKPTLTGVNVVSGIILESTGFVPSDGNVEVYHVVPAIGIGQTLNIPLRLVGYRAVTTS